METKSRLELIAKIKWLSSKNTRITVDAEYIDKQNAYRAQAESVKQFSDKHPTTTQRSPFE